MDRRIEGWSGLDKESEAIASSVRTSLSVHSFARCTSSSSVHSVIAQHGHDISRLRQWNCRCDVT
jgi:hypothetical protein